MATRVENQPVAVIDNSMSKEDQERQKMLLAELQQNSLSGRLLLGEKAYTNLDEIKNKPEARKLSPITSESYQSFNQFSNINRAMFWEKQPETEYEQQMERWRKAATTGINRFSEVYKEQGEASSQTYHRFLMEWGHVIGLGHEMSTEQFKEETAQFIYNRYFSGQDTSSDTELFVTDMVSVFRKVKKSIPIENSDQYEETKQDIRKRVGKMFGEDFSVVLDALVFIDEKVENNNLLTNIDKIVSDDFINSLESLTPEQERGLSTLLAKPKKSDQTQTESHSTVDDRVEQMSQFSSFTDDQLQGELEAVGVELQSVLNNMSEKSDPQERMALALRKDLLKQEMRKRGLMQGNIDEEQPMPRPQSKASRVLRHVLDTGRQDLSSLGKQGEKIARKASGILFQRDTDKKPKSKEKTIDVKTEQFTASAQADSTSVEMPIFPIPPAPILMNITANGQKENRTNGSAKYGHIKAAMQSGTPYRGSEATRQEMEVVQAQLEREGIITQLKPEGNTLVLVPVSN